MKVVRKPVSLHASPKQDEAVIAVGDIHGCYDLMVALFDMAKEIVPTTATSVKLVLLGDQIDRGPESVKVLNSLKNGVQDWDVIPLLGNHEQLLLNVLAATSENFKLKWQLWRGNGGGALTEAAGLSWADLVDLPLCEQKDRVIAAVGPAYVDYIHSFPSHYINGDLLCVHAGIDPEKSLEENFSQDPLSQDLTHWAWIREPFLSHPAAYPEDKFIVHGHSIISGPKLEPNRIGLDTGAFLNGVLSAALFFNHEMTIFQVTAD